MLFERSARPNIHFPQEPKANKLATSRFGSHRDRPLQHTLRRFSACPGQGEDVIRVDLPPPLPAIQVL